MPRISPLKTAPGLPPAALLEAAYCIAEQTDLSGAVQALLRAGHEVLGCERICFLRAHPGECVLRLEDCHGSQDWESVLQDVALGPGTVLGRIALGERATAVRRLTSFAAAEETPDGTPTCIVVLSVEGALGGLFVADYPTTRGPIPAGLPATLHGLTRFVPLALDRGGLGRLRAQFVASVSHELRTPLTSIVAFGEMLGDGDAGPLNPRQLEFVQRITGGSAQLQKIVADLLELSCLAAGIERPDQDVVRIKPFLQDLALLFAPQAAAAQVRFVVQTDKRLPVLHTDQRRLQQACSNFVDNAIKFSPPGSNIRLRASLSDDALALSVQDQGAGIPADQLQHIFEAFYSRPSRSTGTPRRGVGLGLAIVSRIADVLGASVSVTSAEAEGSTFSLVFPRRALQAARSS